MAYCSRTLMDYVARQDELDEALDIALSGSADSSAEAEMIAQADQTVYGWIATKYPSLTPASVTTSTAPAVLRRAASVVAVYQTLGRVSKWLRGEYERLEAQCLAIGKGEQALHGEAREDLPDSVRREALRETRDADKLMADYGEPSPNSTGDPLTDNTFRATY